MGNVLMQAYRWFGSDVTIIDSGLQSDRRRMPRWSSLNATDDDFRK